MTIQKFLEEGRKLLEDLPAYPANSYAADVRAMLPKALKALEVSCEALRDIHSPQRPLTRAIADSRAALVDIQGILEEE